MEIIQLNEELKIKNEQTEVILLIDYKHKSMDIFKHYEDKNFTSSDVVKYHDILDEAYKIGKARLHPDTKTEIKPRVTAKASVLAARKTAVKRRPPTYKPKICSDCSSEFTPKNNFQRKCDACLQKP